MKSLFAVFLVWTFFLNSLPVAAQDLPPTEDLSLGAGVFVFRSGSGKSSQKKFVARNAARVKRSKVERAVTTQKIRKQYEAIAKVKRPVKPVKAVTTKDIPTEQIAKKNPKQTALIFVEAGQFAISQKRFDDAIEYFTEAIDLDPSNKEAKLGISDAFTVKGDEYMEKGEARNALNFYNDAVENNDKNPSAYIGLGEAYEDLDDSNKAIASYESALKLDGSLTEIYSPLGILYFQKDDLEKADQYLTKAFAANDTDAATAYYFGVVRYRQNKFGEAQTALQQAIKDDANQAAAHYYLGAVYDAQNQDAQAITEYNEAIRLNNKYAEAYFGLGVIYYGQKNYQEALKNYLQVVQLQNTNGEAHANLADVYREMKDFGKAEGEYRLATAFIKDDAELFSKYGYVLGKQLKWNSAITELNKAIALSSDSLDYTNLGWAYYNSARADFAGKRETDAIAKLQQAKTALQKSVSLNDKFAPAYLNLGLTLNDLKEFQEAAVALKRATELRRNWIFAINELGLSYLQLKDYNNAVEQFKKVIDLDDKFAIGYYNLGMAEFSRGNVKEAEKIMEKLRPLNRNLANALEIKILGAKMKQTK